MKTIGIIGGIAPESTIAYYRFLISLYRQRVADGNYPSIVINSINMKKMLDLIGESRLEEVIEYFSEEIEKLACAGAGVGFLASNTPHIVFNEIQSKSPIPLVSIVEATCQAVQKMNFKKVGLFGTKFTMQGKSYPQVFEKKGIEICLPDENDQDYIHEKYMSELANAVFLEETREGLLEIARKMNKENGIESLILGGTELPLILTSSESVGIPFLDTALIHAEMVIDKILE